MARVTLQTIADRLGVSRMTVSNAFSRPDQLSAPLRERILSTASELGYAGPDPTARALARGTTGAVGVLLTDTLREAFTDEVAIAFLGAIVEELTPTGLALTLLTSTEHADVVPARDVAIDGALIYSCHVESPARDWLIRRGLPLVLVDQDPLKEFPSVNVDDRGGARASAEHLIELGHRRIALLFVTVGGEPGIVADPLGETRGHPQLQRLLGWYDALRAAELEPAAVARTGRHSEGDAANALELLLGVDDPPTAVLCFSDVQAHGVMRAAADRGLAVPGDLSVVGFDDSMLSRWTTPPLTTVRQDVAAKGRLAASALVQSIEGKRLRVKHQSLPTELVVRDSTAPPRRR